MTVIWTGPFSTAPIPVAQRFNGLSNIDSAAATLEARYRDGDPASSAVWTELYGNLNYQLARDRAPIWQDVFINGAAGSDPPRCNIGNVYGSTDAVYTFIGPITLHANAVRGESHPPQLWARVAARLDDGQQSQGEVRLYSVRSLNLCYKDWAMYTGSTPSSDTYCRWVLPVGQTTWPVSPGWVIPTGEATGWKTIVRPVCTEHVIDPPRVDAQPGTTEWETYLVLCGWGDTINGPLVRAIEVWEEEPGA
jgi:hypothetical protein